ncbi:hypothetical protein COU37_00505 [Candidatus Micrarchaeota archaeon CG10_big_fil_rev_8_21_14_0_10_45_29]|nr:MAG: hypothetical protein COU37_00505 [Candidatus Micrarchaeota archaeon CG10_big_fil_rev_8_21_14_0_10_45_29]
MWELEGARGKMMREIAAHAGEGEVRIKTKPSKTIFLSLLENTRVKNIYMSKGIFATVPKKVVRAVESAGVRVICIERRAGRKSRFGGDVRKSAQKMLMEGKRAKLVAKKLGVPLTSVYFWKKSIGKKLDANILPDCT